jgi:altronate dehydratase small subunit
MASRCFQIHSADNVATALDDVPAGPVQWLGEATLKSAQSPILAARESIARGHKIALTDIATGAAVVKFGVRIGHATQPIARGAWVHLHNLASDLDVRSGTLDLHSGAPTDTASAYV